MTARVARHQRPPCGHAALAECPLTKADWEAVFYAYLGFLQTCRLVSERAHHRQRSTT